jgi:putative heme-binding domain-containing protein
MPLPGGRSLTRLALDLLSGTVLATLLIHPSVARSGSPEAHSTQPARQQFQLQKGDHICIIGNTLAERLQHDGWFETYLYARHPEHDLTIRNLGYSGDELTIRLRSQDFGTPDQWLAGNAPIPNPGAIADKSVVQKNRFENTNTKADVIFAFFGYNESWTGEAGLPKFKKDLEGFIKHTLSQKYNGKSAPRLVLFSPIAFEDHRSPNLPTGPAAERINKNLALYTTAMAEVAQANGVTFVDLFAPTKAAYAAAKSPLTINGIHLNEAGNRQLAQIIDRALFAGPGEYTPPAEQLLAALRPKVQDKAFHWFQRYRVTDGYSTYGGRAWLKFVNGQTNYEVVQRELDILDRMTRNRDQVIWAAARGQEVKPDDSGLPPFVPVTTNKPGKGPKGEHLFLSGEEAITSMTLGKGLKVNLFADEKMFPELVNPVQMAWDTQGRLWVAVWPTYPHWRPGEPYNDKLLIFEDTDGDGKADKMTVFADNLQNPTGFEFYNDGVIVAQAPDLMFLKDSDGDGKADVFERILHGLDTADTHHTANSFVLDPGGALYFQEGTFHHSQVEDPYGPAKRVANGAVFRYEPRTQKFDVYVTFGFANPHGHVFDRWGQDIVIDGTGAQPYHAPLFSGYLPFPQKHVQPPQVYKQRTRPSGGMEILSSQHFPPEFEGNLLVTNCIGFQGILRYKLSDLGGSLSGQELEPILFSSDPNFRPVDCKTGPDGAVYFLDWHNPIIGHMQHNLRDPSRDRSHGRIYRVTYEGRPLSAAPKIAGEPIEKLLELLKHPEDRVRYRVKIELGARDTQAVLAAATKWLDSFAPEAKTGEAYEHARLEVLWLNQYHNVVNPDLLKQVLASPDFRARAAAVRVLCEWRNRLPDALPLLRAAVTDPHPRVRLEAVRAASFFPAAEVLPVLIEVLAQPDDQYVRHVFRNTLRAIESQTQIGTQGGIARAMVKLLTSGQVPVERRAGYIEAICRQGDAADLKAVWDAVVIAADGPADLRRLALEQLTDAALTRKVKPAGSVDLTPLLRHSEPAVRAAAARLAGAWDAAVVATDLRRLATTETEPEAVRRAAVQALANSPTAETRTLLETLGRSSKPPSLRFQAIAALARMDLEAAAGLAAVALGDATTGDDLGILFDPFLTRKGGPEQLAAALAKTPPKVDPAKLALRYLYAAGRSDAALIDTLTQAAKLTAAAKPPTPDELKQFAADVAAKGDPARGEAIFRRADLGCFKCHALNKAGGNVGPELTALGGSSPVDYVVASVLDPNAAVKEQYTTRQITTVEEQVFTGIVVSRDPQRVILRDATGKLITIPTRDIEAEREGKSLMPEGLTKFLTRQELLDLSRFLSELGKPGPYAVPTAATIQRWRVLRPTDPELTQVPPTEAVFAAKVRSAPDSAWETVYGMLSGHLPLAELHQPAKGSVVYLRGEFETDVASTLRFDISGPTEAVWIDTKRMPDKWDGQLRLEPGRHTVIVRVKTTYDPQAKVRVELSKPTGGVGRFEIINGS